MEEYLKTPLPVVNETNIKNFISKYVIVHGKVASSKSNTLYLRVNHETNVDIMIKNFNKPPKLESMIKVIGKVYPDQSLEYADYYQLGDDFDLASVNEMIPLLHHPEVQHLFC
jgi:hypothetical protein